MSVQRWFKPLPATHPLVTDKKYACPVCRENFKEGDIIGLIPVQAHGDEGPGDRNVVAIPIHKKCYYPKEGET